MKFGLIGASAKFTVGFRVCSFWPVGMGAVQEAASFAMQEKNSSLYPMHFVKGQIGLEGNYCGSATYEDR